MLAVNPYITFKGNCRQAIEFYQSALQAEVVFTQTIGESPMSSLGPADNIMHCTMKVGDSKISMGDSLSPEVEVGNGNITLALSLNDVKHAQQLFQRLAESGSVTMPLEKTYWAEAFGMLTDQFGVQWMVNCEASATT